MSLFIRFSKGAMTLETLGTPFSIRMHFLAKSYLSFMAYFSSNFMKRSSIK